jgi:4-hydroxybutyryl-CoA dehydratase/vinylacetyl-CoA-Delta-isomerase
MRAACNDRTSIQSKFQIEEGSVMFDVETLWSDFASPVGSAEDYINSLRGRQMNVFFMGERVPEPVDHPVICPSINAMTETYRLATERPELTVARSTVLSTSRPMRTTSSPSTRSLHGAGSP